jgi:hypothetical protein
MTPRYLCTSCWKHGERDSLYASCDSCSTNANTGQPVKKPIGDMLKGHDSRSNTPPQCPRHDRRLTLFCPACEKEVDHRLVGNVDWRVIAMAGAPNAGKTSLLWSTRRSLDDSALSLFSINGSDKRIDKLIEEIYRGLGQQRGTDTTDAIDRNFAWEVVERNDRGGRVNAPRLLALHDVSGEMWKKLAAGENPPQALQRYLDLVGGVMLVLDGIILRQVLIDAEVSANLATRQANPAVRQELAILEVLSKQLTDAANGVSLAIVISKADLFWEFEPEWEKELKGIDPGSVSSERLEELVKQLLRKTGRQELLYRASEEFRNVKFFAVSALGFDPMRVFDMEQYAPARVEEPLRWLLEEVI